MATWCFSKTIACGTIASAALIYYIIILHNHRKKKETDKTDNNNAFEIKIIDTSSPNIHNKKQIFAKNSVNPNSAPLISRVRQIISSLSIQSISNNPIKPPRNKKLYQIQSKTTEDCNSFMQNNTRSFTHNKSNETITLNNSSSFFEHGNAEDNLNHLVIINNSTNSANNNVQIKFSNSPIKSTLNLKTYVSDDSCTNRSTSLLKMSQKDERKEINIMVPSFNRRRFVEHFITFRGNRLTNAHNNKRTKEMEGNNVTIVINTSL